MGMIDTIIEEAYGDAIPGNKRRFICLMIASYCNDIGEGDKTPAICGSIGRAIATRGSSKDPRDIDILCKKPEDAIDIVFDLMENALKSDSYRYMRVLINHQTEFVPNHCISHIRIEGPIIPVCLFVRPKFESFFRNGYHVQFFNQMEESRKEIEYLRDQADCQGDDHSGMIFPTHDGLKDPPLLETGDEKTYRYW